MDDLIHQLMDRFGNMGRDSTSDDREERVNFLAGRIHGCLALHFGGYDIPPPSEEDTNDFVIRNRLSGLRYRVSVEEVTEQ